MTLRSSVDTYKLHRCLGHSSLQNMKMMVPTCQSIPSFPCEVCEFSKHHGVSFPPCVECRMFNPFRLVHSDIWGPIRVPSLLGFHYFFIFVDDYNQATYFYLMKDRSELYSIFKSFYILMIMALFISPLVLELLSKMELPSVRCIIYWRSPVLFPFICMSPSLIGVMRFSFSLTL